MRARALARCLTLACALAAVACTPQQHLLMSLIPDGTLSTLLSHFERQPSANRQRVAELEQKGDWPELVKFAEENIAKDKSSAAWWMVAGYAYSQQKQHGRAIQCFGEMVRLEPDMPDGWNLLAQEHRTIGESRRALVILENALIALREAPTTLTLLGDTHADLRQFDAAVKAYRRALDLDNGLTPAWAGLARAHLRGGRPGEAEAIARSLEKSQPQLAAAIRGEIAGAGTAPR
jgi:tetratricopeptide (TPR) repeat protein